MDLQHFKFLAPLHATEAGAHLTATLSHPGFFCSSQWLTRCNFPYGKCYCHHSHQKCQSLHSSQCWNLAVICIKRLSSSSRRNQERAIWTHKLVPRLFPLLNCQLTPQLCFELFKGHFPRQSQTWLQGQFTLQALLPERLTDETTPRMTLFCSSPT